MKPSLLILAAGMASRYGGMKQIEEFGPDGETIMDYSIYDAIRAGFGKIVFVIREDFAPQFKAIFDPKLNGRIEVEYVYQHLDSYLDGFERPTDRTKPWGTAHAVLCAAKAINEPFAVINADDFYGFDAFVKSHEFLTNQCSSKHYAIIGYELGQTLSHHGTVNRGVCSINESGDLIDVRERLNIKRLEDVVVADDDIIPSTLQMDTMVSMNFWCFDLSIFDYLKIMFKQFLEGQGNELKSEFFIPMVADQFIKKFGGKVEVIGTTALWFGVTYKDDAPAVKKSIDKLVASNDYPSGLWK